jgi:hypothetical protein
MKRSERVQISVDVEYGNDSCGGIYFRDHHGEIVMWDMAEWVNEPSLVAVIAEAITMAHTQGATVMRERFDRPLGSPQEIASRDV